MRILKKLFLTALITALAVGTVQARILRVPDNFASIRVANDSSRAGDTILVANGRYSGAGFTNIEVRNPITIMSAFGAAQCIISGEGGGGDSVKAFLVSTANVKIIGFTITQMNVATILVNQANSFYLKDCVFHTNVNFAGSISVGVRLLTSTNAVIERCNFYENSSGAAGGAVLITTNSSARVFNCVFDQNRTTRFGGGILVTNSSEADIFNCLFSSNTADIDGGGAAFTATGRGTVRFCTFVNNVARGGNGMGGGIYVGQSSTPNVINSIFWGNSAPNGPAIYSQYDNGRANVSYSCIEGGWANSRCGYATIGEGNITNPPEFVEGRQPDWGLNFFYLDPESPCVDAGSGTAEDLDVDTMFTNPNFEFDSGRADLGFHYSLNAYIRVGTIRGYVLDYATNRPIVGATVVTSRFRTTRSDHRGAWEFTGHNIGPFWIKASAPGFLDSLMHDMELAENQTIEIDFSLLHPEFTPSLNQINRTIFLQDSVEVMFDIRNTGNGMLEWRAETRLTGDADRDPWTFRRSYMAGQAVEDDRLQGVALVDSFFYLAGSNGVGPHLIYILNKQGAVVDSFPQFGQSRYGIRDLTWDPDWNLLWGTEGDTLFGFTRSGELVATFRMQGVNPIANITYDRERQVFWYSGNTTNIFACDRDGNQVAGPVNRRNLRMYGMSYWPDEDGYCLYILHRPTSGPHYVYKMNPETSDTIRVAEINAENGDLNGSFISKDLDLYSVVYMSIANVAPANGNDRIDIWQFTGNTEWMRLDPRRGSLEPEFQQDFTLMLRPTGFPVGVHRGQIVFTHNAEGEEFRIPIALTLQVNSVPEDNTEIPHKFGFDPAHPNPFNATTTLTYHLTRPGQTKLSLYNIAGREVFHLVDDVLPAGKHQSVINGTDLPSGVYLARLQAGKQSAVLKLALVK